MVVGGQSHGERVLQTQSCSEAIRATTVLIALAIAPSLGNTDGEQAPASASPALAPDLRNTLTEEPPAQEAPAHESPTTVYDEPTPHSAAYGDAASNRTGVLSTDPPGVDRVPSPPARRRFERKLQAPLKPAEPAAPMPPRSNRPGTSSELRAAALINVGDLPSIALGLGIGGTWALPYSTVVFGVSGYPKQPEQIPGTVEGRAEFWSVGVHLALCRDLLKTRFRFGPCAGFRGAILRGDGEGSDLENRSGEAKLLLGPTLGVDGGLTLLESLSLVAAIHAHWLPARPRFVVDGATPVHRPEAIGAVASLGVATSWR